VTPFFVTDNTGRILRTGTTPTEAAALMQAMDGETAHLGTADPETEWWDGSAKVARPVLPDPPALTAGAVADWTLPEGAEVTVDPLNGAAPITETVDATGVFEIGLPAGAWSIVVNPPFPYRAASWAIEVNP